MPGPVVPRYDGQSHFQGVGEGAGRTKPLPGTDDRQSQRRPGRQGVNPVDVRCKLPGVEIGEGRQQGLDRLGRREKEL